MYQDTQLLSHGGWPEANWPIRLITKTGTDESPPLVVARLITTRPSQYLADGLTYHVILASRANRVGPDDPTQQPNNVVGICGVTGPPGPKRSKRCLFTAHATEICLESMAPSVCYCPIGLTGLELHPPEGTINHDTPDIRRRHDGRTARNAARKRVRLETRHFLDQVPYHSANKERPWGYVMPTFADLTEPCGNKARFSVTEAQLGPIKRKKCLRAASQWSAKAPPNASAHGRPGPDLDPAVLHRGSAQGN